MAPMTSFHAENCCHLLREYEASGQRQFLLGCTLVFVLVLKTVTPTRTRTINNEKKKKNKITSDMRSVPDHQTDQKDVNMRLQMS